MERIFESLENLNVSEECFNDIMGIVEELLAESNYSVTDVKERTKNALKSRMSALKKGSQDPNDSEAQRNLSRARRAASIMELPNSKRPFKQVQQAANNSVQGRKTVKERNDKEYSENKSIIDNKDLKGIFDTKVKTSGAIQKDSKRYLKSVGLSSKKGYVHPINNTDTPISTTKGGVHVDPANAKGRKIEAAGASYEYQNRYYQ